MKPRNSATPRYQTGQTVYVAGLPGESFTVVRFTPKRLEVETSKTAGYINAPAYVVRDENGRTMEVLENRISSNCLN
jgi:hypothetical protein